TIQHLYTPIQARGNMDVASILAKLHPTPALGGIPKSSALNWLQESESEAREMFGAPIGYLAADGQGEFAVGIRSALLTPLQLRLFAGSGIVAGSQINTETQETAKKFQAILSAFQTPKE
ncbi:isochorismate synthase, partial [Lactobacillus sp. XV13L]|nr:isochorismate synthase [Lactobacillus sp. XV13L]